MTKQRKNIFVKLKEDKSARAITLTVTVMLLVLTAIIVTTVIANRAANNRPADPDTPAGVTDPDPTPDPAPDNTPGDQSPEVKPPVEDKPTDVLPSRFLLPVSGVMQKKHSADLQVFSDTMGDYRVHLGIDIGTVAGANVSAMADGTVTQVWEDFYMGQCVAVAHSGNAYTIYKNLSAELPEGVVVGAAVKAGDIIGTVGESAMVEVAEEPHLHVEMTVNGLQVDPTDYLDEDAKATLNEDTNYEDAS
ncbi:MAG: M23 family metallopeptidase [Clostridia bacterium]|nr:M23 family metallopeptidase [Clostridia bacterium]